MSGNLRIVLTRASSPPTSDISPQDRIPHATEQQEQAFMLTRQADKEKAESLEKEMQRLKYVRSRPDICSGAHNCLFSLLHSRMHDLLGALSLRQNSCRLRFGVVVLDSCVSFLTFSRAIPPKYPQAGGDGGAQEAGSHAGMRLREY